MRLWPILLLAALPAVAVEKAAYDSNGRIIALLSDADDVAISTSIVAVLPNGKRVPIQVRRNGLGATRQGRTMAWTLPFELADGGKGNLTLKSEEDQTGLRYSTTVTADTALDVSAIEFVIDLPRDSFVNGRVTADSAPPVSLANVRSAGPVLYQGTPASMRLQDATGQLALEIGFGSSTPAVLVDRWDERGRSFQARAVIARGPLAAAATGSLTASLKFTNTPPAPAPVHLTLDRNAPTHPFDGFGANYCWNTRSPVADYTMKNLKLGWGRFEMKLQSFDRQRDNPPADVRGDLEAMRRLSKMGAPFVISIWWLPERFYTDPYEKGRSGHFRLINPDKWNELLDLMGAYLQFAKTEYQVEPDLFSFNEANIGIYVGFTPETHDDVIKRMGAYFRKSGFKTKMLLGDATGPRDTHNFVLEAAMDPEALQYVGAVGFHSWGEGTPEQYRQWGRVSEWLNLPLLVTELGVDAAGYYTRSWDSYQYGLREARLTQELLMYAHPQGTQYWQFTDDYAIARTNSEGTVEPLSRFWIMKHFHDLTPQHSELLATSSLPAYGADQKSVLFTAFRKGNTYTLHILNMGSARAAILDGIPEATWQVFETTEASQYQQKAVLHSTGNGMQVHLPSRSLITLTVQSGPASAN